MSLIKCPECGKDVSDKSLSCVHCGNPLQQSKQVEIPNTKQPIKIPKKLIVGTIVTTVLISLFFVYSDQNSKDTKEDAVRLNQLYSKISKTYDYCNANFEMTIYNNIDLPEWNTSFRDALIYSSGYADTSNRKKARLLQDEIEFSFETEMGTVNSSLNPQINQLKEMYQLVSVYCTYTIGMNPINDSFYQRGQDWIDAFSDFDPSMNGYEELEIDFKRTINKITQ